MDRMGQTGPKNASRTQQKYSTTVQKACIIRRRGSDFMTLVSPSRYPRRGWYGSALRSGLDQSSGEAIDVHLNEISFAVKMQSQTCSTISLRVMSSGARSNSSLKEANSWT